MSYGIIRIEKYKKGAVKGIQLHDQREKNISHSNKDIDFDKSHLNYDLHNHNIKNINFTQKVNERIKSLTLKKAVRHDAVVMCQCLITSDNEFFQNMSKEQQDEFFNNAYKFVCHRYGFQNIVSATVHLDEKTPHMHVNFVPVTIDKRLCAKDLFKKKDLSLLHDDFYKFNKSKGYTLERGESKEEFQKHLSIQEFKLKSAEKNIEEEERKLKEKQNSIKRSLHDAQDVLNKLGYINNVDAKKMLIGDKMSIGEGDYRKLQSFAALGVTLNDINDKYYSVAKQYNKLVLEYKKLNEKSKCSVSERINLYGEISDLKIKNEDLTKINNELIDYLRDRSLIRDFKKYHIERKNMEREIEFSNDFDFER